MPSRVGKGGATTILWALLALLIALGAGPAAFAAGPARTAPAVPVLVVDGGVGDARAFMGYWLRPDASQVARHGTSSVRLWTSAQPGWWTGDDPPATYLLAATDGQGQVAPGGIAATDIAWALDRIDARLPGSRAMVVSQGAVGLQLRAYLQDLAQPLQSRRADVAGAVLLGSPNRGLPLQKRYPGLELWETFAGGARLTPTSLLPGSSLLQRLNAAGHRLPRVCRVAVVQGLPAHLTAPGSDGVVQFDRLPRQIIGSRVTYLTTDSSASNALDLPAAWRSQTIAGGAPTNRVHPHAVEQLQALEGYPSSTRVRTVVQELYAAWFAHGAPLTHISTRLVIDTSGSMTQAWSDATKIDAARTASRDYVSAYQSSRRIAATALEDLGLITFADTATMAVEPSSSPTAITARLARLQPRGNTDVGAALRLAVASFRDSPRAAGKTIVFVSDGLNTSGLGKNGILSGPVAAAQRQAIRIDTIAVGSVSQADQAFLERVSRATGGRFSVAGDLFALRTDFLRARASALGELVFDERLPAEAAVGPVTIAHVSFATKRLEVMVIPSARPGRWLLTRDGKRIKALGGRTKDGVTWFALSAPQPGEYAVVAAPGSRPTTAHVLAATDTDQFAVAGLGAPAGEGFPWLVALAILGVAACVLTILISRRPPAAVAPGSSALDNGPMSPPTGVDTR